MSNGAGPSFGRQKRLADRAAVDPPLTARPPSAIAADGEVVSGAEIEAAEELTRMLRRLGVASRRVDGFRTYRVFRWAVARRRGIRRVTGR